MGNVNRTYKVNFLNDAGQEKIYIAHKVNTYVFTNSIQVMNNIDGVTEHIRAKKPGGFELHFYPHGGPQDLCVRPERFLAAV